MPVRIYRILFISTFIINFSFASDVVQAFKNYLDENAKSSLRSEKGVSADLLFHISGRAIKSALVHPEFREIILGKAVFNRPKLDGEEEFISPDGHFKIHYTITGEDSVDPTISNPYNVPDWVYETWKAAARSYRLLVDTLKFDPPPQDNNVDGPEIDIYIKEWGGFYYGMTYPEGPVTTTERQYDYTSYIVIDNNYSESGYYTNGLNALRVTVAHEFFHVVQLGYNWYPSNGLPGIGGGDGDRYFLEWSSMWMEERAYPKVNDYYNYLYDYFYYPSYSMWSGAYWYPLGIFLRFILGKTGESLIPIVWEKIKSIDAFQALQETLEEEGLNLAQLWNEFSSSCYYTAHRYDEVLSLSADAMDFPLLQFPYGLDTVLEDSVNFDITAKPFSTNPIRVTFENNYLLSMQSYHKSNASFLGSYILDQFLLNDIFKNFQINKEIFLGEVRILDTLIVFPTNTSTDLSSDLSLTIKVLPDIVDIPTKILSLFPNPWISIEKNDLNFDLQLGERFDDITLYIFDIQGHQVFKRKFGAEYLYFGPTTLSISFPEVQGEPLPSGIYFALFKCGAQKVVRKFTLVK